MVVSDSYFILIPFLLLEMTANCSNFYNYTPIYTLINNSISYEMNETYQCVVSYMEIEEIKCQEFCIPLINEIETAAIYSGFDFGSCASQGYNEFIEKGDIDLWFYGSYLGRFSIDVYGKDGFLQ